MNLFQAGGKWSVVLAGLVAVQAWTVGAQTWGGGELPLIEPPPTNGTFYLLSRYGTNGFGRNFDSNPFSLFGTPVYGLGSNFFEIDDSDVPWGEVHELVRTNAASRPELLGLYMVHSLREKQAQMATNGGEMELVSGGRYSMESEESEEFGPELRVAYSSFSSNDLWLEIISAELTPLTNVSASLTVHSPEPGTFDLFFRTNLAPSNSWFWVARGLPGQTNFNLTGLPANGGGFFIAGTTNGLDANGVTTAYRILVGGDETLSNDFDHDSLPDAWEINFFGDLFQSGESDFDGDGLYNYGAYTNRSDPNNIQFMLNFPAHRVSSSTVFGGLTLLGGLPAYVAVLVNDSNRANAGWEFFSSTNVPANLSGGDGKYSVQIGLRGRASGAAAAWLGTQLILDTVPPILRITNLPAGTVTEPLLQLQGWANEPLSRVVYDLTNSSGVLTNQRGYITGQFADTNLLQFTTNYFQYYDLPLAQGTNHIGLRATDLAGNTTSTNISIVLDYSAEISIPALTLLWPTNGTQIAADTLTVQAQVDKATVTVEASVVDSSGNTNTVSGLVERSGLIWAKNLALGSGNNTLVLKATSAAGHTTTVSATVVRSALTVAMNPLATNQVNQSLINATGTVSDASALVWVNDVQATVSSNGTWHAADVPVSLSGTAVFDVEAYIPPPPGFEARPSGTADGSQMFEQPQPPRVVLVSYSARFPRESEWHATCDPGDPMIQWDNQVTWSRDAGGAHHYSANGFVFPVDGTDPLMAGDDGIRPPWEQADVSVSTSWQEPCLASADSWEYQVETRLVIEPGGQQPIGETATYLVRARALELARPSAIPGHVGLDYLASGAGTNYAGTIPLSPETLQVNGVSLMSTGETNGDGSVWGWTPIPAPSGAQPEIRLAATQVQQYNDQTFDAKVQQMTLRIFSGTNDITDQRTMVVVGQKISLHCALSVTNTAPTNYQWTVPGVAISNYVADVNSGTVYSNFSTVSSNIGFYWVDGATNRQVQCSAMALGQNFPAKAVFDIQRPNVQMTAQVTGSIAVDTNFLYNFKTGTSLTFVHFGGALSGTNFIHGIRFELLSTDVEGPLFFVQTGSSLETDMATNGVTYTGVGSGVDNGTDTNDFIYSLDGAYQGFVADDSPASSLSSAFTNVSRVDVFTMHLLFQPTNAGAIPVPIKRVDWAWSASTVLTNAASNFWSLISAGPPSNPVPVNSTSYPTWTNHMQPIKWTPPL